MDLPLLSLSFLAALLLAAVVSDLRQRRIPNALVLYGLLAGLAFQCFAPAGQGLLRDGGIGPAAALLGGLAGLALFLPAYALRLMGAGDVKLLAMLGVWLGAGTVLHVAAWTLVAGGLLALSASLASGTLRRVGANVLAMFNNTMLRAASRATLPRVATTGRLPYAVAIASGSAVEMARLMSAA